MMATRVIWVPLCLALVAACEGRAVLRVSPCSAAGTSASCTTVCGAGVQTCTKGSWSACIVPAVRLPCNNACGAGTQLCQDNQLQPVCDVDPVQLPCSNTCGTGLQLCKDNKLQGVCQVDPVVLECSTMCGTGTKTCSDNSWHACTAPLPKQPKLVATIRDFHITFPDMNHDGISETGIVANDLGSDDKPVYAHTGPTATVVGPETFNQWYRDVPGTNISTSLDIPLTASGAQKNVYTYNNTSFFPIDGQLFGNEGQPHNYAFTAEVATRFRYSGGETFTFSGDDDVFVFINRKLAIDLGGIHEIQSQTVDLDAEANHLGLVAGNIYPMHIFFAERHMTGSDFVVETTISEFDVCK